MMSSNQAYFQINSKVARNLHAKFGINGTVPEFFTIFFKQQTPSETAMVTSSMMSSNQVYFQINAMMARNLHTKFGADRTLSEFRTIFSSEKRRPVRPP
jgi:hypothetical protein